MDKDKSIKTINNKAIENDIREIADERFNEFLKRVEVREKQFSGMVKFAVVVLGIIITVASFAFGKTLNDVELMAKNHVNEEALSYWLNQKISQNVQHEIRARVKTEVQSEDIKRLVLKTLDLKSLILPKGVILAWPKNDIPEGWAICDGTKGTPFLLDRFIRGGNQKSLGASEDISEHKHSLTIKIAQDVGKIQNGLQPSGAPAKNIQHIHQGIAETARHLPPYLNLIYIMKL